MDRVGYKRTVSINGLWHRRVELNDANAPAIGKMNDVWVNKIVASRDHREPHASLGTWQVIPDCYLGIILSISTYYTANNVRKTDNESPLHVFTLHDMTSAAVP